MINRDIRAHLKGNRLFLEAPLLSNFNRPYRTHLLGKETTEEFEEGLELIGLSQIKLKSGYQYHLMSCQVLDSKLIKVILGFKSRGKNGSN